MVHGPLHGVLAAALTPLGDGGEALDEHAIQPLADFYAGARVDGVMVAGTTGESLLLRRPERERLVSGFVDAAGGRFPVAVHAGAQSTADAVALASHAVEAGAVAVAAAPPFFVFDQASLIAHFQAIADACAPVPFYLCEIRRHSGYAIPVPVVETLRETAENLLGMKVSDPTIEDVERYLFPDFDMVVGTESLVKEGFARGAVGALSGLAGALPREVVRSVADPGDRGATLGALLAGIKRYPFHAAGKLALIAQNVALEPWVRRPLRQLTPAEHTDLEDWLALVLAGSERVVTP
jgi:dihydrodipicolinate synthase/N-acetylneuraminate lyase